MTGRAVEPDAFGDVAWTARELLDFAATDPQLRSSIVAGESWREILVREGLSDFRSACTATLPGLNSFGVRRARF